MLLLNRVEELVSAHQGLTLCQAPRYAHASKLPLIHILTLSSSSPYSTEEDIEA